jgi:hypothetical protein
MISMEMILITFFAVAAFSFGLAYLTTFNKLKKSNLLLGELFIKNKALEQVSFQIKNNDNLSDDAMHKENFIKFLSDSRDWAYQYIEDVQAGLKKFTDEVKPEIDYFNTQGNFTSMQPNYYSLKKISEAYSELLTLLPKEEIK